MINVGESLGPTPHGADIDDSDDRMSISSRQSTRSHRSTTLHKTSGDGFEKELSFNPAASPASASGQRRLVTNERTFFNELQKF